MTTRSPFVVVANRLPVDEVKLPAGGREWRRSPGGLVTALHPIMRAEHGTWIGWAGGSGPAADPFELDGMRLHPVSLSDDEIEKYYEGFSNSSLWPLYHDAVEPPVYKRDWWDSYREVNERFAAAAAEVAAPGAVVWVQDYQLQLVPALLRELRPDLRIGFFLHIPFPPVELYMQLPRRVEILRGLLGADLVGFQRPLAAQNFLRLTRHLLGLHPKGLEVEIDGRTVRAAAFPISIDVGEIERLAASEPVRARAAEIRHELGDPKHVILGVDRLDYTKGIDRRLTAFEELLEEGRLAVPDAVMVQVATPSRERVEHYQTLRDAVELQVGRINGDHARVGVPAVHYLHQSVDRAELTALYCAADVMMVTPLRDGMNLVAKEYVAARVDLGGTLILSEFAGAASDLHQAYLVNPHDADGLKEGLLRALAEDPTEAARRMRAMRRYLRGHDVDRWARSFLTTLGVPEATDALAAVINPDGPAKPRPKRPRRTDQH
ncbi:alpha,alpha-trehalose-phosphate synthase (UDP-forming) [Actinocatenispora rupis]|uniref:Trehalose-6-phosphate synthase n=1 Tax=Actinocatenispora rupis TaxID=519421 RepID=A0A8J3NC46_9ACTN|nr:trehalose-6-phosphate synthase [Actinocatenispora rupis]GID11347.1 trehalose-6-phosphate synthase [Actinocatenispora rupis]